MKTGIKFGKKTKKNLFPDDGPYWRVTNIGGQST